MLALPSCLCPSGMALFQTVHLNEAPSSLFSGVRESVATVASSLLAPRTRSDSISSPVTELNLWGKVQKLKSS